MFLNEEDSLVRYWTFLTLNVCLMLVKLDYNVND